MTTIYREKDADPSFLQGHKIAVLGYGNQGRSQALNLRDSGLDVLIGNIDDDYRSRALEDGFEALPIPEAAEKADVLLFLLPDEVVTEVYKRDVASHLEPGNTICFASGYNVHYRLIQCPDFIDIILLAPRMIGHGVRELYQSGEGFYSFVGVHRDATGHARKTLLTLSHAVGTLKRGAVVVTFAQETELDLFNEQAFGPAFGRVLLTSIKTLLDAGYPKEAVLLELYMSGEFGYIMKEMARTGLIPQLDYHSQTSQYGAMSRGIKFLGLNLGRPMRKILKNIVNGSFAKEWSFEQRTGKLRYRFLRAMASRQPIGKIEESVRRHLETLSVE